MNHKIIIISNTFYPAETGGPDNSTFWLSKILAEKNKVTVFATYKGIKKKNKIIGNKEKIIFDNLSAYYFTNNFLFFLKTLKFIFKNRKGIIILNSIFLKKNLFFIFFSYLFGIKTYLFTRGELDIGALKYKRNMKLLYIKIIKLISHNLIFISTTKQEKNFNKIFFKKNKNYILPNIIDRDYREYGHKRENYLYFGRIHPKKNIEYIIKCFLDFEKINKTQKLYIVGKVDDVKYYNKLIFLSKNSKNIKFKKPINGNKKYEFLSRFKALILTSYGENFGNVIVESMSVGTTCIVSKNLPWNDIEQNNVGYNVDIQNCHTLIKTLCNIETFNNEKFEKLSKNCKKYLEKKFNTLMLKKKVLNTFK